MSVVRFRIVDRDRLVSFSDAFVRSFVLSLVTHLPDALEVVGARFRGGIEAAQGVVVGPLSLYPQLDHHGGPLRQADGGREGRHDRRDPVDPPEENLPRLAAGCGGVAVVPVALLVVAVVAGVVVLGPDTAGREPGVNDEVRQGQPDGGPPQQEIFGNGARTRTTEREEWEKKIGTGTNGKHGDAPTIEEIDADNER